MTESTGASFATALFLASLLALSTAQNNVWGSAMGCKIQSGGATSAAGLMGSWQSPFYVATNGLVSMFYNGTLGSGGGIAQLATASLDFIVTDAPLTAQQKTNIENTPPKSKLIEVPLLVEGIVMIYHLPANIFPPGVQLNLTAQIIASIYLQTVRYWNSTLIVESNPWLASVNLPIIPVGRGDSSGSSFQLTTYLTGALSNVPGLWPGVSFTPFAGVNGISGVSLVTTTNDMVQSVRVQVGSIGYVSYSSAVGVISMASIWSPYGFVQPSLQGFNIAATAAANRGLPADSVSAGWASFNATNVNISGAYPITSFLYAVTYQDQTFKGVKGAGVGAFLNWAMSPAIQASLNASYYVALPPKVLTENQNNLQRGVTYADGLSYTVYWPLPPGVPQMPPIPMPGSPFEPPLPVINWSIPPVRAVVVQASQALTDVDILMCVIVAIGFGFILVIDQWRNGYFCWPDRRGCCEHQEHPDQA